MCLRDRPCASCATPAVQKSCAIFWIEPRGLLRIAFAGGANPTFLRAHRRAGHMERKRHMLNFDYHIGTEIFFRCV